MKQNEPTLLAKELDAESEGSALEDYQDLLKKVAAHNVEFGYQDNEPRILPDGSRNTTYNTFVNGVERRRLRSAGGRNGRPAQTAMRGGHRVVPKRPRDRTGLNSPSVSAASSITSDSLAESDGPSGEVWNTDTAAGVGDFQEDYAPPPFSVHKRPRLGPRDSGPQRGSPVGFGEKQTARYRGPPRGRPTKIGERQTARYSGPPRGHPRVI